MTVAFVFNSWVIYFFSLLFISPFKLFGQIVILLFDAIVAFFTSSGFHYILDLLGNWSWIFVLMYQSSKMGLGAFVESPFVQLIIRGVRTVFIWVTELKAKDYLTFIVITVLWPIILLIYVVDVIKRSIFGSIAMWSFDNRS